MAELVNYYYSGQGSLYVAARDTDTGLPLGFTRVGNIPKLTVDIEIDKFEHKESESGQRLIDLTIIKEKKGTFNFTLENLSIANLVLGLWGEQSAVTGAAITNEAVTAHLGKRTALKHLQISAVTVTDVAGTTTYTVDTDYVIDAANGALDIPTDSTIAEGETIHVDYTHAAYTDLQAFTQTTPPERFLRFEGINTVDDKPVIVELFRAVFDPLTGYELINEELGSLEMRGNVLADPKRTTGSKFMRQLNLATV